MPHSLSATPGRRRWPDRLAPRPGDVKRPLFQSDVVNRVIAAQPKLRDRVALKLLVLAGVRKGSLAQLQLKDFDLGRRRLRVRRTGRTVQYLPLPTEELRQELQQLILGRNPNEYLLFPEVKAPRWQKRQVSAQDKAESAIVQENRLRLLEALNDARARILLGTDSPQLFNAPGFSVVREMEMMRDAGMTPYQVLRAGTEQPGEFFKRRCGTITPGACADLMLLDANPLQDLRNVSRKRGVMLRGRWLPEDEIQRQLTRIHDEPGNYTPTK